MSTAEDSGPTLSAPPFNDTLEATGPDGAIANFNLTASDPTDGSDPVTYTMGSTPVVSGETELSLGTHLITATATDSHGQTASENFSVTVRDTTPPVITVPSNITIEATGADGAAVDYSTSAVDLVDGAVPAASVPQSGSEFPIGTTTVFVSATDASGNRSTDQFNVTVTDHTPPVITVPSNITVEATSAAGAVVFYSTSAVDLVDGLDVTQSVPHSGSEFPIGTTTVGVSATDSSENKATATFTVTVDAAACYCRGTHISTVRGEIAIENLIVGDLVLTAAGETRAVRWLGVRGIDCARYREPSAVWPICIRAGAIAADRPARDLWVSPGHCLFIDGHLIQAENLINGANIVQLPRDHVEYWHLELENHDIIVSEGMPAESYLDTGNRTAFANGGAFIEAFPDFRPKHWKDTCVPMIMGGAELVRAKTSILARALTLGHVLTDDSGAHVVADGKRFDPLHRTDSSLTFSLPAGCTSIEMRCRTFIPAQVTAASRDRRALGICVEQIQIDGADIALGDDSMFTQGWHALECHAGGHQQRWSGGCVPLPAGAQRLVIGLAGRSYCWEEPATAAGYRGGLRLDAASVAPS